MKYKNIRKQEKVDTYLDNLFIAVTDMFWDMIDVDISPTKARSLVLRNVKLALDETMKQFKSGKIR
tara:strand:- start:46 stop:243 length:198 start_codon:yes stop_codon:yes gene_type:complete